MRFSSVMAQRWPSARPMLALAAAAAAIAVALLLPKALAQAGGAGSCDSAGPYVGMDDETNRLVIDSGPAKHVDIYGKLGIDE